MKNIAYHILDIVHNSVQARASLISITLSEDTYQKKLKLMIADDGTGMTTEQVESAYDPYFTSRKTRHVGMGLALLKQNAEQCEGSFSISSKIGEGTTVSAVFDTSHIDCPALGDIVGTIHSLITTIPDVDFWYMHEKDDKKFTVDTRDLKTILEGVPLYHKEIKPFLRDLIAENLQEIGVLTSKVIKHN
jgi:hypothetical protein